jgi:DNA-binding transcriptional MerR regulator
MIGFMPTEQGLPSHKVWQLARMPASTLNYWVQTRLISPSLRRPEGKRVEQWWSLNDVVVVRTIRALRQAGASLQIVRKTKRLIENRGDSLSGTRSIWDGRDIALVDDLGEITSVSLGGQQLLFVLEAPLGDWYSEAAHEAEPVDVDSFQRQSRVRRRQRAERVEATASFLSDHPRQSRPSRA